MDLTLSQWCSNQAIKEKWVRFWNGLQGASFPYELIVKQMCLCNESDEYLGNSPLKNEEGESLEGFLVETDFLDAGLGLQIEGRV